MRCGVHQRLPRAADRPEQAPQASPAPVQMRAAAARASRHDIASVPLAEVTQRRPNRTGLPDGLKTGIETLSGLSMDRVRVHRSSAEPARIGALAHARGADIHLGPGQERHLPHEAWHVVQQAQGRVRPTMQLKRGDALNDDSGLEREADAMGGLALRSARPPAHTGPFQPATSLPRPQSSPVVQAYRIETSSTQRELLRSQSPAPGIQPATRIAPAKLAYAQQLTRSGQTNFRVADDRSMAVQDTVNEPKDFFAKDAVFDASNRRLAQAGSPVRLTKSGGQVKFGNNTLRKIRPDRPADRQYREFASLWSDICITIANHIMGNRGQHKEDVVLQSGAQQASASITVGGLESSGIDRLAAHLSGRARPTLDAASTAIRTGPGDRPGKRYGLASANGDFRKKRAGSVSTSSQGPRSARASRHFRCLRRRTTRPGPGITRPARAETRKASDLGLPPCRSRGQKPRRQRLDDVGELQPRRPGQGQGVRISSAEILQSRARKGQCAQTCQDTGKGNRAGSAILSALRA